MGLDSVEIVLNWEESFDLAISDREAAAIRTPRMAVDLISERLNADNERLGSCLTLRSFGRIRRTICLGGGVARPAVKLSARLKSLLPSCHRPADWAAVQEKAGQPPLTAPVGFLGRLQGSLTVAELALWNVTHAAYALKPPGEKWTRAEIRAVVRAGVQEVLGISDFSDDDDFIRDLNVD